MALPSIDRLLHPERETRPLIGSIAAAAWLLIAAAAWFAPRELNLLALAVIAVAIVTWHAGWPAGAGLATVSALNDYIAGTQLGPEYSQHGYLVAATIGTFVALSAPVVLIGCLHAIRAREITHARVDYLTGALNTAGFADALAIEISRHQREKTPFALACLDCTGFRQVNARIGRRNGDALLQLVVDTLKRGLRKTDVIARIGGDEFAILLPQTGLEQAQTVVHQLVDNLHMASAASDVRLNFTVGVGIFPESPSVEDVLAFVDRLMPRARDVGGVPLYETYSTELLVSMATPQPQASA